MKRISTTSPTGLLRADENCPSDQWVGETRYHKLWRTPDGYDMIDGRMTRIQTTTPPPHIWPEMWQAMSKKQKENAVFEWSKDKKLLDEARQRRGLVIGVDGGDPVAPALLASANDEEKRQSIAESKAWISISPFPACPVLPLGPVQQEHRDKDQSPLKYADLSCLVAKQISIKEAKRIPGAKAALDKEWAICGLSRHGMLTPSVSTPRFATGPRKVVRLLISVVFSIFAH